MTHDTAVSSPYHRPPPAFQPLSTDLSFGDSDDGNSTGEAGSAEYQTDYHTAASDDFSTTQDHEDYSEVEAQRGALKRARPHNGEVDADGDDTMTGASDEGGNNEDKGTEEPSGDPDPLVDLTKEEEDPLPPPPSTPGNSPQRTTASQASGEAPRPASAPPHLSHADPAA